MQECYSQMTYDNYAESGSSPTLKASGGSYGGGGSEALIVDMKGDDNMETQEKSCVMATQQGEAEIRTDDRAPTLTAAAGMSGNNQPVYCSKTKSIENKFTVRRLTPLECERLQGFPDGWTHIGRPAKNGERRYIDSTGKERKTSDSARYKALGNSIALPPWFYVLTKLSVACGADTTMASLFDGIGGFPLIWEYLNGKGSCLWASEIEEFPMAVTAEHFNE